MSKAKSNEFLGGAFVRLSELVHKALERRQDEEQAYSALRGTYQTKAYLPVWPRWMIRIEPRAVGAKGSRKRDFTFLNCKRGRCFVRNLWFLHQFFTRPKDVLRFINSGKPEIRAKQFVERAKELGRLSATYNHWSSSAQAALPKIKEFEPSQTDLLQFMDSQPTAVTEKTTALVGSPAFADAIREVESRRSYIAGNPKDACERALYFLEMGSLDIAHRVAREELMEHPDDPVTLYTNAVLLIESGKRYSREAFLHETLHDPSLTPVTAEEQWHCDRHDEAMEKAWEAAEESFQLLLRAWKNWPDKFKIKAWRFGPELWREQIEDVILSKAAIRCDPGRGGIIEGETEHARERRDILGQLVRHVLKQREKYICRPLQVPALRNFIVVAASLWPEGGRQCLANLASAVAKDQDQPSLWWDELSGVELPRSEEPTLSEALLGSGSDTIFCRAVFQLIGPDEGFKLIEAIETKGETRRHDRELARRNLNFRKILAGKSRDLQGITECLQISRPLADYGGTPSTLLGASLKRWWRYAVIRLLFEASCLNAQSGDSQDAITKAEEAAELAKAWFTDVGGNQAMVRFMDQDEDGETELVGDWLRRMPNIITDPESVDRSGPGFEWMREYSASPPKEFAIWAAEGHAADLPLLVAYGQWLSARYGEAATELASKLTALRSDAG